MDFVRDRKILDRIGCKGRDEYACYVDGLSDDDKDAGFAIPEGVDLDEDEFDNTNCDADFEKVADGYTGTEGFMKGAISRMRKRSGDMYPTCVGIYSADGMYRMESRRGVTAYLGKDGRGRCVAIPQCKMMNSTVLDGYAKRTVYTGDASGVSGACNGSFGKSGMCGSNAVQWLQSNGFGVSGTHVPFDLWCVMGTVFGKVLKVWRGIAKRDMRRMPSWMYVELQEVFEGLNTGCRWSDLSVASRKEWTRLIWEAFRRMRSIGLAWDLPNKGDNGRTAFWTKAMLESTCVYRRVDKKDEQACAAEWGDEYEPCGFKVNVKGNAVFKFCWQKGGNSPAVVQVREYEHDAKRVLGVKGWSYCFQMIWASWLVQYRNYWVKHGLRYDTCVLEWSQKEMLEGFRDSVFEIRHLSTDEMRRVLEYHTRRYVLEHDDGRPAHIEDVSVVRRCVLSWTMPKTLENEAVLVKDERKRNLTLAESKVEEVPDEVRLAKSRQEEINRENAKSVVTLDGKRISTSQSVICSSSVGSDGVRRITIGINQRGYTHKHGVQSLSKEDRSRLKINAHTSAEVDYSSLHLNIAYALNGKTFSGDGYDIGRWYRQYHLTHEEARSICKMMTLRMFNAKNRTQAIYSFKKTWNEKHGRDKKEYIDWLYDVYDGIMLKHQAIAHEFCRNRGVYFMHLDGILIREVCHRLVREGICALSVHDSVIVEKQYVEKAKSVMVEEYAKMFNGSVIKVK